MSSSGCRHLRQDQKLYQKDEKGQETKISADEPPGCGDVCEHAGKSKTKQEVCAFIAKNELGFDDVRMLMQDFRLLQSIPEPHRWCEHVVLSCTCHRFQLDGWCKHSLAEGLRLKLVTFPVQHQDLQLSRRNAPGRPKKTRPCLEVQAGEAPQSFGVPELNA